MERPTVETKNQRKHKLSVHKKAVKEETAKDKERGGQIYAEMLRYTNKERESQTERS